MPVMNLVKPFLIVRELWERLFPPGSAAGSATVIAWWLAFVGSRVALTFVETLVDDLATLTRLLLVGLGLDALAALLAILILIVLERHKDERWRRAIAPWAGASVR